jgi:hypothetical protein
MVNGISARSTRADDVVIIQSDERSRGKWPLGVVDELYKGHDGVVRAVKLRAGKTYLERAVNHLYPLELSCDRTETKELINLNPEAASFRPRRDAAVAAQQLPPPQALRWAQCSAIAIYIDQWL